MMTVTLASKGTDWHWQYSNWIPLANEPLGQIWMIIPLGMHPLTEHTMQLKCQMKLYIVQAGMLRCIQ